MDGRTTKELAEFIRIYIYLDNIFFSFGPAHTLHTARHTRKVSEKSVLNLITLISAIVRPPNVRQLYIYGSRTLAAQKLQEGDDLVYVVLIARYDRSAVYWTPIAAYPFN